MLVQGQLLLNHIYGQVQHTHTHTYTHIHIHTHAYTYMHIRTHTHIYTHTHTHTYIHIRTYIHTHTCTHIHTHTHTHTYAHTYIHIHTYAHRLWQHTACNHINSFFYFHLHFLLSIRDSLRNHSVRDDARTYCMRCLGCRVEAGAEVNYAILCDGAVVKRGARVGRGCGTCVRVSTFFCYLIKYSAIYLYISISSYVTIWSTKKKCNVRGRNLLSISAIWFSKLFLVQCLFLYLQLSNFLFFLYCYFSFVLWSRGRRKYYCTRFHENQSTQKAHRGTYVQCIVIFHLIFAPCFLPSSYPSPSSPLSHTHTHIHTHTYTLTHSLTMMKMKDLQQA